MDWDQRLIRSLIDPPPKKKRETFFLPKIIELSSLTIGFFMARFHQQVTMIQLKDL